MFKQCWMELQLSLDIEPVCVWQCSHQKVVFVRKRKLGGSCERLETSFRLQRSVCLWLQHFTSYHFLFCLGCKPNLEHSCRLCSSDMGAPLYCLTTLKLDPAIAASTTALTWCALSPRNCWPRWARRKRDHTKRKTSCTHSGNVRGTLAWPAHRHVDVVRFVQLLASFLSCVSSRNSMRGCQNPTNLIFRRSREFLHCDEQFAWILLVPLVSEYVVCVFDCFSVELATTVRPMMGGGIRTRGGGCPNRFFGRWTKTFPKTFFVFVISLWNSARKGGGHLKILFWILPRSILEALVKIVF